MKIMGQFLSCLAILISVVVTCKAQDVVKNTLFKKDVSPKEYPRVINNFATQLKLESIENGIDSIQLRVWYIYEMEATGNVLVLSNQNSKWRGDLYGFRFRPEVDKNRGSVVAIYNLNKNEVKPKSGWKKYVTEVNSLQIMTLPSMKDIPGLKDMVMDGSAYYVEASTRNLYRLYSYHQPNEFKEFWQAQNMVKILDLTKREFGIPWK